MAATLFDDGKDAGALRTIGEVSTGLGIRTHVLRYWEEQFPELQPLKRAGGRRLYRPEDVVLVQRIDRLINREGYTLKGARAALAGAAGASPAAESSTHPAAKTNSDLLPKLRAIRAELAAALAA